MKASYTASFLPVLILLVLTRQVHSRFACNESSECEIALRPGSECIDGFCTNPLHKGGCLATLLSDWDGVRICNSQDPLEAEILGYCRPSPFNYTEVRIFPNNWESPHIITWMLQIILSELLQTPVSVEVGSAELNSDLYNINSRYEPTMANVFYPLENSLNDTSCSGDGSNEYVACAHVMPEVYAAYLSDTLQGLEEEGTIESPSDNGFTVLDRLWIPARTADREPALQSFYGVRKPDNRRLVAESFLTPTTWSYYCSNISPNNCSQPDDVAARAPETEEEGQYFAGNRFTGHFRKDFLNDCDVNSDCKGAFLDYPCEWGVNTHQKLIHLDLPLEPRQYSYSELTQIMAAANATKSDIIHWWWYPEPTYLIYEGTDSQFTHFFLPAATTECLAARTEYSSGVRCEVDPVVAAGSEKGACEDPEQKLKKIVATTLRQLSQSPELPSELWSPAYDVITKFELSNDQVNEVFKLWQARNDVDKWNYDLRDATCQWVVEHMDIIQTFVPETFPRVLEHVSVSDIQGLQVSAVVGAAATLVILAITFLTVQVNKKKVAVHHAQPEILCMCLMGLFLYMLGSLLAAFHASDVYCGTSVWFLNVGYVLAVFPLIVKLDAINKALAGGAGAMQRIRLNGKRIGRLTATACFTMVAYLIVWSVLDLSREVRRYELSSDVNDDGDNIVWVTHTCASKLTFWVPITLVLRAGMVICGLLLGLMASRNGDLVNGAKNMVMLFFSQCAFVGIQACVFSLQSKSLTESSTQIATLVSTMESLLFLSIYIWPKLIRGDQLNSEEPVPDLYLKTTIMMAEIVGFAKWSSTREPSQVFKLLETIFSEFDRIAEGLDIFKVAASGIPQAKKDHAVSMARFAAECLFSIKSLMTELEVLHGPDTGDLSIRIGLHSGPVTGGFLRGKGSRFQLFGRVVNIAAQMLSCGAPGMIHCSESTAEALNAAGKSSWITKRSECINAEENMQTYWIVEDVVPIAVAKISSIWKLAYSPIAGPRTLVGPPEHIVLPLSGESHSLDDRGTAQSFLSPLGGSGRNLSADQWHESLILGNI